MGAGASSEARGAIRSPFPVSPQTGRDLTKLSYVVNRILNTADIYDINNLAKPGVCGDYAVFLKQQIATQLLNFNAESEDGSKIVPVAYQNPTKAFAKQDERQRICQQIATTMLTVITTVVACLGSIQVSTRPAGLQFQQGGGTEAVRTWLGTNGYIVEADRSKPQGEAMQLQLTQSQQLAGLRLTLTLLRSDPPISSGMLAGSGAGSLRIQLLDPIVTADGAKQVLPLRIVDEKGLPWVSGMLLGDGSFKSFSDVPQMLFVDMLDTIYRNRPLAERRDQIAYASYIFDTIRRDPSIGGTMVARILGKPVSAITTFPSFVPAPVSVPVSVPVPTIVPALGMPGPSVFAPAAGPPIGYPSFAAPFRPVARPQPGYVPPVFAGQARYDVPYGATAEIQKYIKRAQSALGAESNPAAVRAYLLAGEEKPNRTVLTAVCSDPYWSAPNLSSVYPWATLQLLAVKDLTKMGEKASVKFHDEWTEFLEGLKKIYDDADIGVSLQLPSTGPNFLDSISVKGLGDSSICRNPVSPYKPVQDGLLRLQGLYEEHVAEIWEILNGLIVLVVDPVTKAEIVKLHPKVIEEGTASRKYVERVAARAREAITAYYLDVEKVYVGTIQTIIGGR